MQGYDFNIEGTTWWKQDGSDHFTIRSVFFDGSGMSIQTDDGRMVRGDVLQDYIQSDSPIGPKPEPTIPHINKALLMQGMSEEEIGDVFINDTPGLGSNLANPIQNTEPKPTPVSKESENDIIIKRLLDKLGYPKYNFNCNLEITEEYVNKLKQSIELMGLSVTEVRDYIYKHIEKDRENIYNMVLKEFETEYNRLFDIHEVIEEPDPVLEVFENFDEDFGEQTELMEEIISKPKNKSKKKKSTTENK